jgi:hypothetical protein
MNPNRRPRPTLANTLITVGFSNEIGINYT